MPWIKFSVMHGPGHQGTLIEYEWWKSIDAEEIDEYLYELCRDLDWPISKWEEVDKVPEDVAKNMIEGYQRQKAHAEKMISLLKENNNV